MLSPSDKTAGSAAGGQTKPFISNSAPCAPQGLALERSRTRGAARRTRSCGGRAAGAGGSGVSRPSVRRKQERQMGVTPSLAPSKTPSQPGRALPPHPLIVNEFPSTIPSCPEKPGQGQRTGHRDHAWAPVRSVPGAGQQGSAASPSHARAEGSSRAGATTLTAPGRRGGSNPNPRGTLIAFSAHGRLGDRGETAGVPFPTGT